MIKSVVQRLFGRGLANIESVVPSVVLLTVFYTVIMMSSVMGSAAADTLFLSHYDMAKLSYMYLYITVAVVLVGIFFQKVSERVSPYHLLVGSILGVGGFVLLTGLVLKTGVAWIYPVMFVGYEANTVLLTMAFFTFMATVLDARNAKRYIGTVAAGGVAGTIIGGFATSSLAPYFGTELLVYVYAVLVVFGIWFVRGLQKKAASHRGIETSERRPQEEQASEQSPPHGNPFKQLPILKYIAIIIGTISVAITLTDYQFKMTLGQSLSEAELASFLGMFYSVTGVIAFVFQVFVSTRLLTRYGIVPAFLIMPLSMLFSSIAFFLAPVLLTAVVLKASYRAFAETIHQSVHELMYFPIPAHLRGKAKGLVGGVIDYGMSGVAALLLIIMADKISLTIFSIIAAVMLFIAILAIFPAKREYVQMLLVTLRKKQGSMSNLDLSLLQAPLLAKIIEDHNRTDAERLHAFRLLGHIPQYSMERHLAALLANAPQTLQLEVLEYMERAGKPQWTPYLQPLLLTDNSLLLAKVIQTLAVSADNRNTTLFASFLEHPAAEVRIAAIYGLLKHGGPDEKLYESLKKQMQSPDRQIRRHAITIAGKLADPRLLPDVLMQLRESGLQRETMAALALFPLDVLLHHLQQEWDKPHADEAIRLYTAKILAQHPSSEAYRFLQQAYQKASTRIRASIVEAMSKLYDFRGEEQDSLSAMIEAEARHVQHGLYALQALQLRSAPEMVLPSDALLQDKKTALSNLFALVSLLYDKRMMETIAFNLESGDRRQKGNALEAMDNLLQKQHRGSIMPVILANYDNQRVMVNSEDRVWTELYEKADDWLKTCLLHLSGLDPAFARMNGIRPLTREEEERITQVGFLKQASSFSELSGYILAKLAADLQKKEVKPGTTIIQQGEIGDALYLILHGEVQVVRDGRRIERLGEGELFGEMSLFDSIRRTATVISATPVTLGVIGKDAFYDLLSSNLELAISFAGMLSKRIRRMNEESHSSQVENREDLHTDLTGVSPIVSKKAEDKEASSLTEKMMILLKVDMFASFSHTQLAALAELTEEVTVQPGETIMRYGEPGDALYGIISGRVSVERDGRKMAELHQGDVIGEMALLERAPRSASVTALETSVLVKIRDEVFYDFCYGDETVIRSMIESLASRLRSMQGRNMRRGAIG